MERLVERKKASNEQLDMMLQLLSENKHLAKGRITGKKGHAKAWVQIANALNAYEFGAIKPPQKWLQTWRDLRCNTKKRAARISRGLAERNSLTDLELKVLDLVGVSPVIAMDIPESTVDHEETGKVWLELTNGEENILENSIGTLKHLDQRQELSNDTQQVLSHHITMDGDITNTSSMENHNNMTDASFNPHKKRKIQKNSMIFNTLTASTKRIISVGKLGGRVKTTALEQEIMSMEQEKLNLEREKFEEMKNYHKERLRCENQKITLLEGILTCLKQDNNRTSVQSDHNILGNDITHSHCWQIVKSD